MCPIVQLQLQLQVLTHLNCRRSLILNRRVWNLYRSRSQWSSIVQFAGLQSGWRLAAGSRGFELKLNQVLNPVTVNYHSDE